MPQGHPSRLQENHMCLILFAAAFHFLLEVNVFCYERITLGDYIFRSYLFVRATGL